MVVYTFLACVTAAVESQFQGAFIHAVYWCARFPWQVKKGKQVVSSPLLWRIYACFTDHMHSGATELLIWSPSASIPLS